MPIELPVHLVEKEQYLEHLRTRKRYTTGYPHNFKIVAHREFDITSFYCRLYHFKGNDNYMILKYPETRLISSVNDYLENGKEFYVTSNGWDFYKVLTLYIDSNNYLEMSLRQISNRAYVEQNHFFMIMPFRYGGLNNFYLNSIKHFLDKRLGVSIVRADDFTDTDVIIETIYKEIEKSEFVICDITHCNKNAFYEIGYAKALDKQMIFLLQEGHDHDFFDVAHIRRIEYAIENPESVQARLIDTIETMRGKR